MAGRRRARLIRALPIVAFVVFLPACRHAGILEAPPGHGPTCAPSLPPERALGCHAPILMQETAPGPGGAFDHPTPLDPDGSGTLRDDAAYVARGQIPDPALTLYGHAVRDSARLYLFYGIYYAADWAGSPAAPDLDHLGDFEGALIVVEASSGRVEAAVTQAHKLFYLWLPEPPMELPDAASGTVAVERGRAVLFAESGGHGLYAFGRGAWSPAGGRTYPEGPAALPPERLRRLERVQVVPLGRLEAFTDGPRGPFRDLPDGANPPWLWVDRRRTGLAPPGAIILAPDVFYRAITRATRP